MILQVWLSKCKLLSKFIGVLSLVNVVSSGVSVADMSVELVNEVSSVMTTIGN